MKYLITIGILILLLGCDLQSEISAIDSMRDMEKVWVFAQFNVKEENDGLESFFYYGKVSKKLYEAISYNEIGSGFILLKNVKFWGKKDLIYDYKDIENSGELIFRIENIAKMKLVNIEPVAGKGLEQFEEPVKEKFSKQKEALSKSEKP